MNFKEEMLERYRRAYAQHPGLEQFRQRKKALLWGIMGLFALQKLLIALALGSGWGVLGGVLGLVIPAIFALTAWRGDWKFSLVLLIPAATIGLSLVRDGLPALLAGGGQYPLPVYLSVFVDAALVLCLAGTAAWLSVPEKNREYGAILNRVTEELILLNKQMAASVPAAPADRAAPPQPEPPAAPPAPVQNPAPVPAPDPAPAPESPLPSCYQQIVAVAGPEGLPGDFSLDYNGLDTGKLRFAEGAQDGICMYHTNVQPGDVGPLHEILALIAAGYLGAGQRLEEFFRPGGPTMLPLIDGMQDWIVTHKEELDPDGLYRFALRTMKESRNRECVKFALSLLELVQNREEDRQVTATLALCDEFTLYSMYVIRGWENGNQEMFRLARQVHGWGRIFLVHELEPDTPEIQSWLFREGWRNTILTNYSARVCAQKSGLAGLLAQESITGEEYVAARALVTELLCDSPLPGASGMEEGEQLLRDFLRHAAVMGDRKVRQAVEQYLEKHTGQEEP